MPSRSLESLVDLVAALRAPDGCPWDIAQTHQSLTGFLIEESYEVVHAIEDQDSDALKEELGDLLLHFAFHVQLARECGEFDLKDVLDAIHEKIIRRHPHVFGKSAPNEMSSIKLKWEELKEEENQSKEKKIVSFPALVEARKFLEKRANLGINSENLGRTQNSELVTNLRKKIESDPAALGKILFEIVAISRELGIEPEIALKKRTRELSKELEKKNSGLVVK
jgi:tetrapyrrole methylase family protein/MazG family protein